MNPSERPVPSRRTLSLRMLVMVVVPLLIASCAGVPIPGTLAADDAGCVWLPPAEGEGDAPHAQLSLSRSYDVASDPVRIVDAEGRTVVDVGDPVSIEGTYAQRWWHPAPVCDVGAEHTVFVREISRDENRTTPAP